MNQALTTLARHEARNPVAWVALAAAAIAWPITIDYSPLSATLGSANAKDVSYDVAFVLAAFGALYSNHRLGSKAWLFSRASTGAQGLLWFGLVGVGALLPALLALAPLAVLEGPRACPGIGTMALVSFHMASIILFLQSVGFSRSERSLGLILLAVALPAVLPANEGFITTLTRVLTPTAGGSPGASSLLLTAHHIGSIVGLLLLAQALRSGLLRPR